MKGAVEAEVVVAAEVEVVEAGAVEAGVEVAR